MNDLSPYQVNKAIKKRKNDGSFDGWGCPHCDTHSKDKEKLDRILSHYGPACHHDISFSLYKCNNCNKQFQH